MATISEALGIAIQHHRGGRLQAAEQLYRQILQVEPNHTDAIHLLGMLAHQVGKLDEAVACWRRVLELNPDDAEACSNLAVAFTDQGKLDEAIACCRQALQRKPDYAETHYNLGNALSDQGKLDEAIACYGRALELKPDYAEAHNNLGVALTEQGKLDLAVACCHRALELKPDSAEAHNNLGKVFRDQGKLDEAVACHCRALELKPDFAEAHYNLGVAFRDQGKLDEATASYRRVLELKPNWAAAHSNLGIAFWNQGMLEEAIACHRRALELTPDSAEVHSNLVYTQIFCPVNDAQTLHEERQRWSQHHAASLVKFIEPHLNDRSPDRRLRVGYVSPDFRRHPVGVFLLPLLESHDHESFEIFCYSSVRSPDALTDRCRAHADVWRDVLGQSDEQVAHTVHQDRIDILVDLTMHMGGNRLLVFARKPAPVQVTYLAYCGTTGLNTVDYRLTDPYLDPPGQDERFYSEHSVRLAETYWCYRPIIQTPPVNSLPALPGGRVTFGCLNNFCKVTAPTLAAWSRLLRAVPGSQLVLHAHVGSHRDRVRGFFAEEGVSPERVTFSPKVPLAEYSAFTSESTWPWTHSHTVAAPRPVMRCGWVCRW
jgi:predicted O-linked N-acetylglucosamine transferase (SPINDLY family)